MKHICLLLVLCGVTGCISPIYDRSEVGYIQDGFDETSLEKGGLALLPVTAAKGQQIYRYSFGDAINEAVLGIKPDLKYLEWRGTISILNQANLVGEYEQAISSYHETGILDRELMRRLGEAVGVRYLLFIELHQFYTTSQTEYDPLVGFRTDKRAKVGVSAQVWDCSVSDVVWGGRGIAKSQGTVLSPCPEEYAEYSRIAATGLIRRLLNIFPEKSHIDRATPDYWR
jgi:hypothetical protein